MSDVSQMKLVFLIVDMNTNNNMKIDLAIKRIYGFADSANNKVNLSKYYSIRKNTIKQSRKVFYFILKKTNSTFRFSS